MALPTACFSAASETIRRISILGPIDPEWRFFEFLWLEQFPKLLCAPGFLIGFGLRAPERVEKNDMVAFHCSTVRDFQNWQCWFFWWHRSANNYVRCHYVKKDARECRPQELEKLRTLLEQWGKDGDPPHSRPLLLRVKGNAQIPWIIIKATSAVSRGSDGIPHYKKGSPKNDSF